MMYVCMRVQQIFQIQKILKEEREREREMAHGNFADFIGICLVCIAAVSVFLQDEGVAQDTAFLKVRTTYFW